MKNEKIKIAKHKFKIAIEKNEVELSGHVHDVMRDSRRTPRAKQYLNIRNLIEMLKFTKKMDLRVGRTKGRDVLLCEMRGVTLLLAYDRLMNFNTIFVISIWRKGWRVN